MVRHWPPGCCRRYQQPHLVLWLRIASRSSRRIRGASSGCRVASITRFITEGVRSTSAPRRAKKAGFAHSRLSCCSRWKYATETGISHRLSHRAHSCASPAGVGPRWSIRRRQPCTSTAVAGYSRVSSAPSASACSRLPGLLASTSARVRTCAPPRRICPSTRYPSMSGRVILISARVMSGSCSRCAMAS